MAVAGSLPRLCRGNQKLTVGKILLERLRALAQPAPVASMIPALPRTSIDSMNVLRALDLTKRMDKKDYEGELLSFQGR